MTKVSPLNIFQKHIPSVRCHYFIDDVIDLSLIARKTFRLKFVIFNVRDFINKVVSLLSREAAIKGVVLSVYYAADLPETVNNDPVRLKQTLVDLLTAQIKFTFSGSITISLTKTGPDTIRISVTEPDFDWDNTNQKQIRELFGDTNNVGISSPSDSRSRVGISLTVSKLLVEDLGPGNKVEEVSDYVSFLIYINHPQSDLKHVELQPAEQNVKPIIEDAGDTDEEYVNE